MKRDVRVIASAAYCLFAVACANTAPTAPSASASSSSAIQGGAAPQSLGGLPSAPAPNPLTASAVPRGVTDITLKNAGWSCIGPINGLILCAPPGLGLPSIPPVADGPATYQLTAFTLNHEFFHRVHFLRLDLYHGQPCQGGDPWVRVEFLGYYECIIPD